MGLHNNQPPEDWMGRIYELVDNKDWLLMSTEIRALILALDRLTYCTRNIRELHDNLLLLHGMAATRNDTLSDVAIGRMAFFDHHMKDNLVSAWGNTAHLEWFEAQYSWENTRGVFESMMNKAITGEWSMGENNEGEGGGDEDRSDEGSDHHVGEEGDTDFDDQNEHSEGSEGRRGGMTSRGTQAFIDKDWNNDHATPDHHARPWQRHTTDYTQQNRQSYNTAQWEDRMHTALQSHDYAQLTDLLNTLCIQLDRNEYAARIRQLCGATAILWGLQELKNGVELSAETHTIRNHIMNLHDDPANEYHQRMIERWEAALQLEMT